MSQSIFALARAIGATQEAQFISYCRLRVPLNWKTSGKNSVRRLDLDDTDILLPKQIPRVIEIYEILLSARD